MVTSSSLIELNVLSIEEINFISPILAVLSVKIATEQFSFICLSKLFNSVLFSKTPHRIKIRFAFVHLLEITLKGSRVAAFFYE